MGDSESVSFRRITAICYLRGSANPWQASDGGALRLYPPAITASTTEFEEGGNDNGVVFKFASWLGISDKDSQQPEQQEQGIPASAVCGGEVMEDNGKTKETGGGPGAGKGLPDGGGDGAGDGGGRDVGDADGGDNHRDGKPGGGEGEGESYLDVAPLPGRAVVFLSGAVEHEVLPVTGPLPRAALTTWFH